MNDKITSWRELITKHMRHTRECWGDVESHTLTEDQMDKQFDTSLGSSNGTPFTLWTKNRVYFPVVYDGEEWVESASRNPDGKPTHHVGQ